MKQVTGELVIRCGSRCNGTIPFYTANIYIALTGLYTADPAVVGQEVSRENQTENEGKESRVRRHASHSYNQTGCVNNEVTSHESHSKA